MAYVSYYFGPYNAGITYSQFDILWDGYNYYYSTQPNNVGNNPYAIYQYNLTSYGRYQDLATLTFTYTGGPSFAPGSMVSTSVTADGGYSYNGMITQGSAGAVSGVGSVSYINAGWDEPTLSTAGTITSIVCPAWTTGFMFIPSYSSPYENQQGVISAQFEQGYEQRQAASINPNTDIWSLAFLDRSSKEARAIRVYTQNAAGVYSFPIMITDPNFGNQPNQKFITAAGVKINPKSFNVNDVSVQVRRVFDL
jgi:phage-related protein